MVIINCEINPNNRTHIILFQVCIQVLIGLDSLLSYISDSNDVTVTNVLSMPKNVAEITYEVFTHCQKRYFIFILYTLLKFFRKCTLVKTQSLNLFTKIFSAPR